MCPFSGQVDSPDKVVVARLIVGLLKSTRESDKTSVRDLMNVAGLPTQIVKNAVESLARVSLVSHEDSTVAVTRENRLNLALEGIKAGTDLQKICSCLSSSEFEDLGTEALRANGYKTLTRFVFKHANRKYEIDIIGRRGPTTICIDCKHWKYGLSTSRLLDVVSRQIERTEALVMELGRYVKTLAIPSARRISFLPVVLTLTESQISSIKRVPVVPIVKLMDFLGEFDLNLNDLLLIRPELSSGENR